MAVPPFIKVFRTHQWLKNILVFLPVLAAHKFEGPALLQAGLAFAAFCLVASSVYVLNDLVDVEVDRAHPRKKTRPFASGAIPVSHGPVLAGVPLILGVGLALYLGWEFTLILTGYYLTTLVYSFWLKKQIVIDICVLAGLYTFRIISGAAAAETELSFWLLAFSIFFFLSLAAVKRQGELVDGIARGKIQASGRGYLTDDLPIVANMAIASGYVSVLIMALYITSPDISQFYLTPRFLWGICPVLLYWLSRMVMIAHRGRMHDDPIVFAVRDRISLGCFWLIFCLVLASTLVETP